MDQNQNLEDNDLQKAIDNITNNDPVFSDPVAAPSSVPEGDSGELGEPVGPFPEAKVGVVMPEPEPMAPVDPISIPDLGAPGDAQVTPAPHTPEPIMPAEPSTPEMPEVNAPSAPAADAGSNLSTNGSQMNVNSSSTHQIKEAALRDMVPLLGHVSLEPEEKFELCKDIYENLHDSSVFDQAYQAASGIKNEDEKAKALLYIIETIE